MNKRTFGIEKVVLVIDLSEDLTNGRCVCQHCYCPWYLCYISSFYNNYYNLFLSFFPCLILPSSFFLPFLFFPLFSFVLFVFFCFFLLIIINTWNCSGRLIVDATLEASGTPINKLDGPLCLYCLHCCTYIF